MSLSIKYNCIQEEALTLERATIFYLELDLQEAAALQLLELWKMLQIIECFVKNKPSYKQVFIIKNKLDNKHVQDDLSREKLQVRLLFKNSASLLTDDGTSSSML